MQFQDAQPMKTAEEIHATADFKEGLFHCHRDWKSCLCGLCVPCVLAAQNKAEVEGYRFSFCDLLEATFCFPCFVSAVRAAIRDQKGYRPQPTTDCVVSCICCPCAVCQQTREFRRPFTADNPDLMKPDEIPEQESMKLARPIARVGDGHVWRHRGEETGDAPVYIYRPSRETRTSGETKEDGSYFVVRKKNPEWDTVRFSVMEKHQKRRVQGKKGRPVSILPLPASPPRSSMKKSGHTAVTSLDNSLQDGSLPADTSGFMYGRPSVNVIDAEAVEAGRHREGLAGLAEEDDDEEASEVWNTKMDVSISQLPSFTTLQGPRTRPGSAATNLMDSPRDRGSMAASHVSLTAINEGDEELESERGGGPINAMEAV
uniref:Uncharacterized protein n=1 Tax=Chromera velia CCMP2878 TaxID=1169474 RepID=A0A0G4FTH8_9ALVE|eukprot:Cvel_18704.t1-p1 / transcript=Cvel_18704.t1 / gene=Cvel_18704 / organism=Chromera_velia_CCMP2878 / gene_product=Cornifelin homolog B, putative / transcript_product=Cornifelin homolog B, putative / location=Cvel_scaffold1567:11309-12424(+) / protein_length=372 / sequence_SO=supercontig / SO=protein_coding / is_pseudo=false